MLVAAIAGSFACSCSDDGLTADDPDVDGAASSRVDTHIDSAPEVLSHDSTARFTFSSARDGATFECALDSPPSFAPCASPAIYADLADGVHTFAVRASAGGATDGSPATFSWSIDSSGPIVSLTAGPAEGETTGRTVSFAFSSEPGARFFCALDSVSLEPCPAGFASYSELTAGPHSFRVAAATPFFQFGPTVTRRFTVAVPGTGRRTSPVRADAPAQRARQMLDADLPGGDGHGDTERELELADVPRP